MPEIPGLPGWISVLIQHILATSINWQADSTWKGNIPHATDPLVRIGEASGDERLRGLTDLFKRKLTVNTELRTRRSQLLLAFLCCKLLYLLSFWFARRLTRQKSHPNMMILRQIADHGRFPSADLPRQPRAHPIPNRCFNANLA